MVSKLFTIWSVTGKVHQPLLYATLLRHSTSLSQSYLKISPSLSPGKRHKPHLDSPDAGEKTRSELYRLLPPTEAGSGELRKEWASLKLRPPQFGQPHGQYIKPDNSQAPCVQHSQRHSMTTIIQNQQSKGQTQASWT